MPKYILYFDIKREDDDGIRDGLTVWLVEQIA